MEKIIGYCGIICTECPAFKATENDDDTLRNKTAKQWNEELGMNVTGKDINCKGCLSKNGIIFQYCKKCEIKECGEAKDIPNCGYCSEYSCSMLSKFLKTVPYAKKVLDKINSNN